MAIGVRGLNGVPVLSRVTLVSRDETDHVPIHIQTNMVTIVLENPETTVCAWLQRVQVRIEGFDVSVNTSISLIIQTIGI